MTHRGTSDPDEGGPPGGQGRWLLVTAATAVAIGAGLLGWASLALGQQRQSPPTAEIAQAAAPTPAVSSGRGGGNGAPAHVRPESGRQPEQGITSTVDIAWADSLAEELGIPQRAFRAYAGAPFAVAEEYPDCGLGWNTLAGIGLIESHHGTISGGGLSPDGQASPPIFGIALNGTNSARMPDTDKGALDGDAVWDRAVGPMQFIPSTWATWGSDGSGDGIADPQQIDDAVYSAARYLCMAGGDLRKPRNWITAVAAYNRTVEYNNLVAGAAEDYAKRAESSPNKEH